MVEIIEQHEKAYQKQAGVNVGFRRPAKRVPGKHGLRYHKTVGLGIRTPKEAIEGKYIDKKCPFTGTVTIRGRMMTGIVKSTKMTRTIVVRRNYMHFIRKYSRYEKRHTNTPAHISPCFRCKEGDKVQIGECRPISKTVRFNVLKVFPSTNKGGKGFGSF
ncbi:unnamed protein product [Pedinophyceae sp. YPF-701]|nr:unnamed protein product [Pedinophyceae sp. YPF-701]